MSMNAQKRLLIVMGSTGDRATDTGKIISARTLTEIMRDRFPNRSYNFGTIVVYMGRLRERFMTTVIHQGGELRYRLSDAGFDEARKLWNERSELGYAEPAGRSVTDAAAEVIDATAKEFIAVAA